MYRIGDKIVYPMHGAGIIESVEEREILGVKQDYYVLKIAVGDMKVMIPTNNIENVGVRDLVDKSEIDSILLTLKEPVEEVKETNWNKRYRENMNKLKTGSIENVAEVVRALMVRERDKGLSTGEKKMLSNAKRILISEVVLSKGVSQEFVEDIVNDYIYGNKAKAQ